MDIGEALIAAYMTLWSTALGALVWATHRRLEHRIDRLEERMDRLEERWDTSFVRLEERGDNNFASLRADITQIALAVGASPRASEG